MSYETMLADQMLGEHRPLTHSLIEGEMREDCSFCARPWPCSPYLLAEAVKDSPSLVDRSATVSRGKYAITYDSSGRMMDIESRDGEDTGRHD